MSLTVLSVGYPLAPVAPDTAGGAEQVLLALDGALCRGGHRSLVLACRGSRVAGTLIEVPVTGPVLDEAARRLAHERYRMAIAEALRRHAVDVVHMHGVDFHAYLPAPGLPVVVTLHLPLSSYVPEALRPARPATWLHCVSAVQQATAPPGAELLPPIENGVAAVAKARRGAGRYALMLARLSPEKGIHLGIEAARRAGLPLVIAGQLFPYAEHLRYFEAEVRPRLGRCCRWIGPVGPAARRHLLAGARCLLIPSLAEETSSLVAREAAAAGTPVVAFACGALRDVVEHGRTGFLVNNAAGMAQAIARVGAIDPEYCRAVAGRRFSLDAMLDRYLGLYARLAARREAAA